MDADSASEGGPSVVMLGPPGSGKGTQAQRVAERLGIPAISTGDTLREAVASGTELGRRVEGILARGDLVDDEAMAEVVRGRLLRSDTDNGFLLDGFPRTLKQVAALKEILAAKNDELDAAILLQVPEEELMRRVLARGRNDDSQDVIKERLRLYREKTRPVVDYYQERSLLLQVDGEQTIEEVTADILAVLNHGA